MSSHHDGALKFAADVLDDLERTRIANANRLRILTTPPDVLDEDGIARGMGIAPDDPAVKQLANIVTDLERLEHEATLALQRQLRQHPLAPWCKAQVGIGEKQGARLLAAIGDPYLRDEIVYEDGRTIPAGPRSVSALWAYAGLHVLDGAAVKRKKGVRSNWSTAAKTRAYLVSTSCIKQAKSPYRAVYDARRAHTAVTRPDWTAGHSHNDALRVVSKAVLRDLWRAARELHEPGGSDHTASDTRARHVAAA